MRVSSTVETGQQKLSGTYLNCYEYGSYVSRTLPNSIPVTSDNRSHKAPLVVRRQAEPLGDYINVQKDHTLSGCSCTVRSVSEALAEPDL